jgi:hypothetical protein
MLSIPLSLNKSYSYVLGNSVDSSNVLYLFLLFSESLYLYVYLLGDLVPYIYLSKSSFAIYSNFFSYLTLFSLLATYFSNLASYNFLLGDKYSITSYSAGDLVLFLYIAPLD